MASLVINIASIFVLQAGAFYVTSRAVQMPPQLHSLLELVTGDINYRYTDTAKVLKTILLCLNFMIVYFTFDVLSRSYFC